MQTTFLSLMMDIFPRNLEIERLTYVALIVMVRWLRRKRRDGKEGSNGAVNRHPSSRAEEGCVEDCTEDVEESYIKARLAPKEPNYSC